MEGREGDDREAAKAARRRQPGAVRGALLCTRRTNTELIRYPDGIAYRIGEEPHPTCASCPYREGNGPIRHVEVVKRY